MAALDPTALIEQLESYASTCRPFLNSFLARYRGSVLVERYFHGCTPETHQHIFSVTKSVVSALVGLALGDGKLTLSDTLLRWFPEMSMSAEAATVTLQHLLTMTAGFERLKEKQTTFHPIERLLRRKTVALPGKQFQYDNDDPSLVVAIIERAVGEPVLDYAHRRLFAPLGIWNGVPKSGRKQLWKVNKEGLPKGGFGLHLTTRELAAFGQLYLQSGKWQGDQLLPAEYVSASTTMQVSGSYPEFVRYGYYWWASTDSAGRSAFFASGAGGQYIYVMPARDLVVVITSAFANMDARPRRVMVTRLVSQFLDSAEGVAGQ